MITEFTSVTLKSQHAVAVNELIVATYQQLGCRINLQDFNLINDNDTWKIIELNGILVAGVIYRPCRGSKIRLVFNDGTVVAKSLLKSVLIDDLSTTAWVEASGPLAAFLLKSKVQQHELDRVQAIFGPIERQDNGFYTRIIDGVKTKPQSIFGVIHELEHN